MNEITVLSENTGQPIAEAILCYIIPFLAFYLGIIIRYSLRESLFPNDKLKLKELMLIGILFSITTISPLIPTFYNALTESNYQVFLSTIAVVIQGGLFIPESISQFIKKQKKAK